MHWCFQPKQSKANTSKKLPPEWMCVLSGFPRVQVNNLAYWAASPVGRTGSDQREKVLNRHRMTSLPHWVPPCNSFPGVVLTDGCSNDVRLSDVRFWSKLILAAAAWPQNQMRLFSQVMLGCASTWHLPLRVAALCWKSGGWLLTLATLLKAAESWTEIGSASQVLGL